MAAESIGLVGVGLVGPALGAHLLACGYGVVCGAMGLSRRAPPIAPARSAAQPLFDYIV